MGRWKSVVGVGAVILGMVVGLAGVAPPAEAATVIIFEDGFESGDLGAWDNVSTQRYAVTSDPARVKTGTHALEGTIPAGPGWGEINKWFMPGYDEVYVRFDVMFEEGFENLRGDGHGMHFASVSGNRIDNKWSAHGQAGVIPNGYDFFTTTVDPEHRYDDPTLRPLMFYSYFPDMKCCYGNVFTQSEPKVNLIGGRWHEIIVHVDGGTPGRYDGGQRLWIDGQLQIDVQGMRWRDTTDLRVNEFHIVDYMPGSPKAQHIWFDNIMITTEFPGSAVGQHRFVDVGPTDPFYADIDWLAEQQITNGCMPEPIARFCPGDVVTREQMAAFLVRALGLPASGGDRFVDDDGSLFEPEIEALAAAGITAGCNAAGDRFCPGDGVTREQMAAFLHRALGS